MVKHFSFLVLALLLFINNQSNAQKDSRKDHILKVRANSKGLSLKAVSIKTTLNSSKPAWSIRMTLFNNSSDTIFYFFSKKCEASYFMFVGEGLFIDFEPCSVIEHTVFKLLPSSHQDVDLLLSQVDLDSKSKNLTQYKFKLIFRTYKAKNLSDQIVQDSLSKYKDEVIEVWSNKISVKNQK